MSPLDTFAVRTAELRLPHRALAAALVVAATASVAPCMAQDINGFLRDAGELDVALSYTGESYDRFWVGETKVSEPALGEVSTQTISLWAAYGLTEDLTLQLTLPWVDSEGDGPAGLAASDLQDLAILGLYRLTAWGDTARSQLVGGIGFRTPASSYEADLPVSVGDGTTDVLFRLSYLLQAGSVYVSQQVGYDLRGGTAPDGFPLLTEIGYTYGRATINGFFSKLIADGGTDIGDPGFTFPSNREEYERIGAKLYYRASGRCGLSLTGFTTLSGRNTGDSSGLSLGFNVRF